MAQKFERDETPVDRLYDAGEWIKFVHPQGRRIREVPCVTAQLESPDAVRPYLDELQELIPTSQWIVVAEGPASPFVLGALQAVAERGRTETILYVGTEVPASTELGLEGVKVLQLDPRTPAEKRFAANLPADLAIIADESTALRPAASSWEGRAVYTLVGAVERPKPHEAERLERAVRDFVEHLRDDLPLGPASREELFDPPHLVTLSEREFRRRAALGKAIVDRRLAERESDTPRQGEGSGE